MPALPHGPWKKLASAQWDRFPLSIYQNTQKVLLFTLFEKKEDKVTGVLVLERMPFVVEGDISRVSFAQKEELMVIEKTSRGETAKYAIIDSTPKLVEYSEDALAKEINRQYDELESKGKLLVRSVESMGAKIRLLSEAGSAEAENLLADPVAVLSLATTGRQRTETPTTTKVLMGAGKDKELATAMLQSLQMSGVVGEGREKRLHAMHVIMENALLNSVPVIVFDSQSSFTSLSIPNREKEDFAAFGMNTTPLGFPYKEFTLGESFYIDLNYVDVDAFLEAFGLAKADVAPLVRVAYSQKAGKVSMVSDIVAELGSLKDSKDSPGYLIGKAVRVMKVVQKKNADVFGKNASEDLAKPWKDGNGKALHLNVLNQPMEIRELAAYSVLEALSRNPTSYFSALLVFEPDANTLSPRLVSKINDLKKQGKGFVLHAEHELELQPFGDFSLITDLIGNDAVVSEAGVDKKRRITIRPAYSQCTEGITKPETGSQGGSRVIGGSMTSADEETLPPAPKPPTEKPGSKKK